MLLLYEFNYPLYGPDGRVLRESSASTSYPLTAVKIYFGNSKSLVLKIRYWFAPLAELSVKHRTGLSTKFGQVHDELLNA